MPAGPSAPKKRRRAGASPAYGRGSAEGAAEDADGAAEDVVAHGEARLSASWVQPDAPPKCLAGHAMGRCRRNPAAYRKRASCDFCSLQNLAGKKSFFYHCVACKFDACQECAAGLVTYRCQGGGTVEVLQDTTALMVSRSFEWRVWGSAAALSRCLESRHTAGELPESLLGSRRLALELGAGSALASAVLAKLAGYHVIATDMPEVLALTRSTIVRNFPEVVHGESGRSGPGRLPACPSHPRSPMEPAAEADMASTAGGRMCSICRAAAVSGQETTASPSWLTCPSCPFRVCSRCVTRCRDRDWTSIPCWLQTKLEAPVGSEAGEIFWRRAPAAVAGAPDEKLAFAAWPLDWSHAEEDVHTLRQKAEVSLVLAADVSYDPGLVGLMLSTLSKLCASSWVAPDAELILVHQRRAEDVDSALMTGLAELGVKVKPLDCAVAEAEGLGRVQLFRAALSGGRAR